MSTAGQADQRALRDALGRFATGITVITAVGPQGELAGMTANSFAAVSLDPPLVLWSVARDAPSFAVFRAAEHFAVSVLRARDRDLSNRFATAHADKFSGVDWRPGLGGAPVLAAPLASFECRTEHRYPGGDHLILVGRVERFAWTDDDPLLFYAGHYELGVEAPQPDLPDDAAAPFPKSG